MSEFVEPPMTYEQAKAESSHYDQSHGSFFDRGSADSWYSRPRDPHRGGVGGVSGPRIEARNPQDIEAYHAGYNFNELWGGKKSWD